MLELSEGIITATAYNRRGITTGTLMGKCFADYIVTGDRESIPLPFKTIADSTVPLADITAGLTEIGLTLYYLGQCLRIIK